MTTERNRRWAAIAADMRDHPLVGIAVPPPKANDPKSHAQPPFVAFADLILSAAYAPHEVRSTNGSVVRLERGQFLAGRAYWAKRWNWGEQAIRGFFTRLADAEMIAFCNQSPNQPVSVARLCNYEAFQSADGQQQPRRQPRSNQTPTNEQPHTTRDTKIQKEVRETRTPDRVADSTFERSILDAALADYNRAAEVVGFTRCAVLSTARAKALTKRLHDLGRGDLEAGRHRFREALSAIPHDRFLSGRVKGTNGRQPYRLDLDKLLSTGSGSGDVLAKLCDLFDEHGSAEAATSPSARAARPAISSAWAEAQAEEMAAQRARFEFDPTEGRAPDGPVH